MIDFDKELVTVRRALFRSAVGRTRDIESAHDLVNDTIVRALRFRRDFDDLVYFRKWIFRIQANVYNSEIRKRKTAARLIADLPKTIETEGGQESTVYSHQLFGIFQTVSGKGRPLVLMSCLAGMTNEEIAAKTGIPLGTVKPRINRLRAALAAQTSRPARSEG